MVAAYLREQDAATGVIEGHTDNTGNAAYNTKLSQRRAMAVEKLLTERYGVNVARISSVGYGMERPIADNNTPEGRQANRRVVVKVTNTEQETCLSRGVVTTIETGVSRFFFARCVAFQS